MDAPKRCKTRRLGSLKKVTRRFRMLATLIVRGALIGFGGGQSSDPAPPREGGASLHHGAAYGGERWGYSQSQSPLGDPRRGLLDDMCVQCVTINLWIIQS